MSKVEFNIAQHPINTPANITGSSENNFSIPKSILVRRRNDPMDTKFNVHIVSPEQANDFRETCKTVADSIVNNPDGFTWSKEPADLIRRSCYGKHENSASIYLSLSNEKNNVAIVGGLIPAPQTKHDNNKQVELAILHSNREFSKGFSLSKPLILFLAQHAKSKGMQDMILHVTNTQEAATGLYEKLGFIDDDKYSQKYDNPIEKTICYAVKLGELSPSFKNTAIEAKYNEYFNVDGTDTIRTFPTKHMLVNIDTLIQNIENDNNKNWK